VVPAEVDVATPDAADHWGRLDAAKGTAGPMVMFVAHMQGGVAGLFRLSVPARSNQTCGDRSNVNVGGFPGALGGKEGLRRARQIELSRAL